MKKSKNQYIQANKDWLVAKSKEDGVKALLKGVYYKVLAEGDHSSATPTPSSVITAHYTGKTIDGATFDSSRGDVPLACRLRDLIEGLSSPCSRCTSATDGRSTSPPRWATANTGFAFLCHDSEKPEQVRLFSRCSIGSQPGIPGGSTLIFDIELLAINYN